MACRGCLECLLKLLNFLLAVAGLGMIGYGIYLFVEYKRATDNSFVTYGDDQSYVSFGRPLLMAVTLSSNVFDNLPKAWYVLFPLLIYFGLNGDTFFGSLMLLSFVIAGSYTCSLVLASLCLLFLAVAVLVLVQGASAAYLVYPNC